MDIDVAWNTIRWAVERAKSDHLSDVEHDLHPRGFDVRGLPAVLDWIDRVVEAEVAKTPK